MSRIFLEIINISLIASFMIICILFIRLLFKKAPKKYSYILWILLLTRLFIPISFETSLNPINMDKIRITNHKEGINELDLNKEGEREHNDIRFRDRTEIREHKEEEFTREGKSINNNKLTNTISNKRFSIKLEYLWLMGVIILLFNGILSNYKLRKKLKNINLLYDNVYESHCINTGFVYGFFKPMIVIPSSLNKKEREYIIAHEKIHVKRYDYIIKLLYSIILSLHWFNPFIWLAFRLMSKDMELSCDEAVLKDLEQNKKVEYAETLLSMSISETRISSFLAFSKKDTKSRIKNALEFKNRSTWVRIILIIIVIIIGFFMFTKSKQHQEMTNDSLYEIENREFKDPREAADLLFKKEYETVLNHSDDGIKILEKGITHFEKIYSYTGYLNGDIDIYKWEYKIKAEDPEMFNVIEYQEDNSITEEKMSLGKPLLIFKNNGNTHKFMGIIYLGERGGNETKIGVEIELIDFLENKGLKAKETFTGNHHVAEYKLREGGSYKILLSQPAKEGEDGIWCVDRWMDNHGMMYYEYIESELDLKTYYNQIQGKADAGKDKSRLDYKDVALNFIKNNAKDYDFDYSLNVTLEDFYTLPVNQYYGYIMETKKYEWSENNFIDFDKVEFLTLEDKERLHDLEIDENRLADGYYINNPTSYPDSFIIEKDKDTKFYVLDDSGKNNKEIGEKDFIEYVKNNKNNLYKIVEIGFDVIEIREITTAVSES